MKRFELSRNNIGLIRDLAGTNLTQNLIDDHNNREIDHTTIATGVLVSKDFEIPVLLVKHCQYFCINKIYFGEDDKVHLSRMSVGGVVDLRFTNGLLHAIANYNAEHCIGNGMGYSEETLYIVGQDSKGNWVEKSPGIEEEFIF